ncbi:hypothetical protein [Paenibacillus alvei]|uniref:hypothetical protein n=1 Tax=Paenibacillus alvei TaxID=44250 RepID=UPI0022812E74|nr:hypothetical protein [Paenibacillus alvei]MCY7484238.1 hypothetical protein [Paenibacillus alvei]
MIYLLFVLVIFIGFLHLVNYVVSREDNDPKPPFKVKLWLVPVLALLLLTIVSLLAGLFAVLLTGIGALNQTLSFPNRYAAFTVSMYIILLFLLVESFIHPFIYAILYALLKTQPTRMMSLIVNVIGDTLVIYFAFNIFPYVSISGLDTAFYISVLLSILGQICTGFEYWIKKYMSKKRKGD